MATKEKYENGKYEDDEAIDAYVGKPWSHEVAAKAVEAIRSVRPFAKSDYILDYGGGPGLTLEKIYNHDSWLSKGKKGIVSMNFLESLFNLESWRNQESGQKSQSSADNNSKPFDAVLVDLNPLMIEKARKTASKRFPQARVQTFIANAFEQEAKGNETTEITPAFKEILSLPPKHYDVCIISLVTEYLTIDQAFTLCLEMLEKLSEGGALGIFEWSEHFAYPDEFASTIQHMQGWSKSKFLGLAARISDAIENPNRILDEEKATDKGLFPSKPEFRLEITIDSFLCEKAHTQDCPSSDTVNYMIIRKHNV